MVPSRVRSLHLGKTLAHCSLAIAAKEDTRQDDYPGNVENVTIFVKNRPKFEMVDVRCPQNKITIAELCNDRYPTIESSAPHYPPVNALVESLSVKRRILKSFAVRDHADIVIDG